MSTFEMFVTLAAGGKVILLENLLDLTSVQAKDEVTCINTVPSAMAELVRAGVSPKVGEIDIAGGRGPASPPCPGYIWTHVCGQAVQSVWPHRNWL